MIDYPCPEEELLEMQCEGKRRDRIHWPLANSLPFICL